MCYYFRYYHRCKFGSYCKYSHENPIQKNFNNNVVILKEKVKSLEDLVANIKEEIVILFKENEDLKSKLKNIVDVENKEISVNSEKNIKYRY